MKAEKIKNISEAVDFAHGAGAPLPSPWGRWRGAALRRTVTDEGSPPLAGLTAAGTFANLWSAAEHRFSLAVKVWRKRYTVSRIQPLSQALFILKGLTAPLAQLAFERRQWRMQRERQAAAVRKCESE